MPPETTYSDNSFPGSINTAFGETVAALLATKNNQTWVVLGDEMTLNLINSALQLPEAQGGCSINKHDPELMSRDGPEQATIEGIAPYYGIIGYSGIYPWSILQWYRGSSIAFGNVTYDNLYAHNNNNNTDYWTSSPLNTTGIDTDFLKRLNTTIAAVAPILNPSLIVRTRLNTGQIVGAVIGSVGGATLLLAVAWFFIRRHRQRKQQQPSAMHAANQSSSFSTQKGVGLGEAPPDDDYELAERRPPPAEDFHHT